VREDIERIKLQIEELKRKGDFNKVAELQYGKLPELDKRLKEAQAQEAAGEGASGPTAWCAPRWAPKKSPRW
jgi:ATP-dependent Clp protease ATP-binding subunit ClpB